ncbi:MAG: hypothetical protein QW587_07165 [Candidatus Bathyarchaeia archaeon]
MRVRFISIGLMVVLLAAVNLLLYLQVSSFPSGNAQQGIGSSPSGALDASRGIVPFERISHVVPLDVAFNQLAERGLTLYLPTELPSGLKLMAVYAKGRSSTVYLPVIVVYSSTGDSSIDSAELAIEIDPGSEIAFSVIDSSRQRFMKLGNWTVYVDERAPTGGLPGYTKKYGTDHMLLLDLSINGLEYCFTFAPGVTLDEAIQTVASMKPARTGTP